MVCSVFVLFVIVFLFTVFSVATEKSGLSLRWCVTNSLKIFKQYLNILKCVNSVNVYFLISCILAFSGFIIFKTELLCIVINYVHSELRQIIVLLSNRDREGIF